MLGLFDWNKKTKESSKLNLPTNLGSFPSSSQQSVSNIPDDIPMQLPKFPDFPNNQSQELKVPSFSPESLSPQSQNSGFGQNELHDDFTSNSFQNNPVQNENDVNNGPLQMSQAKNNQMGGFVDSKTNVEDSINAIRNISDSMKKDPNNPFEKDKLDKALNLTPKNMQSSEKEDDYSDFEGEVDHTKFRDERVLSSPLFVNVIDFATILEDITEMKTEVTNTNNAYIRISNMVKDKEIQFSNYDKILEDIQKKLVYVDKILFES
jgi:hypothetical protein